MVTSNKSNLCIINERQNLNIIILLNMLANGMRGESSNYLV